MAAPLVAALLLIVVGGYGLHWAWTGYRTGDREPLTLWDWLSASLLPLALAATPVWLRSRIRHHRIWVAAACVLGGVLLVLVVGGYVRRWTWTGFTGNTLWDWVKLFMVPFLLPFAFHLLATHGEASHASGESAAAQRPEAPTSRSSLAVADRMAPRVGAVVLACSLVAVIGLLAAGPTQPPGESPAGDSVASSGSAAPAGATSRTAWTTVDSRNSSWTDTHVRVQPGAHISIDASGEVLPSRKSGYQWASPAGLPTKRRGELSISTRIRHAALIATIAVQTPAPLRSVAAGQVIQVGVHRSLVARARGELYLGVNDKKTEDNNGWFTAEIRAREARPSRS